MHKTILFGGVAALLIGSGLHAEESKYRVRVTTGFAGPLASQGDQVIPDPNEPHHTTTPSSYTFLALGLERSLGPRHGIQIGAEQHFPSPFDLSDDLLFCMLGDSCGFAQFHTWNLSAGPYYRTGPMQFAAAVRWHPDPYAVYSEDNRRTTVAFDDAFGIAAEAEYQFKYLALGLRYEWVQFEAVDRVYLEGSSGSTKRVDGSNIGAYLTLRF